MASSFTSASFLFSCTNAEMALLEEAFQAADDLYHDMEPTQPSPQFLAIFPPSRAHDVWSAFLALFGEPSFPCLGADISGGNSLERPDVCEVLISGREDSRPSRSGG